MRDIIIRSIRGSTINIICIARLTADARGAGLGVDVAAVLEQPAKVIRL